MATIKKNSFFEEIGYLGYLLPLILFYFLNPTQVDIRYHQSTVDYFWLIYVSIAFSCLLCLKFYLVGPRPRWSLLLSLLLGMTVLLLITTIVFHTIPEQTNVKRLTQLILISIASISAYLIGTQFRFNSRVVTLVTITVCVAALYGIFTIIRSDYFFYLRPYGWSNYILPFFLFWIVRFDTHTPKPIRYAAFLLFLALIVLSGTRTLLLWALFGFLIAQPKQLPFRLALLAVVVAIGSYIYLAFINVDGFQALVDRYAMLWRDNRSPLWNAALSRIADQNILLGGGYFSYPLVPSIAGHVTSAHNAYLHLLLIGGGIGLLIGLAMLTIVIIKNWRVAPAFVFFLPVVGIIGELPLFPYTYTRIFENSLIYFTLGMLVMHKRLIQPQGISHVRLQPDR